MDFLEKLERNTFGDLYWNIPEQRQGIVNVIGGNAQNLRTPVKVAEFLMREYPLKTVHTVLPDSVRDKLPPAEELVFLSSTESGSLADTAEIKATLDQADSNLLVGDLSKNAITAKAVMEAVKGAERPVWLTRDTVDLVVAPGVDALLLNENVNLLASLAQLSKLLAAAYYPRVVTLSQSLIQVAETLHKFTLSYPVGVTTLHDGQMLIARDGRVVTFALGETGCSPFTLWSGEVAGRVVAMNLFNPGKFVEATVAGLWSPEKMKTAM